MTTSTTRKVKANMSLTIDGRYTGPGGPRDLSAIVPYMSTEVARNQMTRMWQGATTALLGRRNAEGFIGFWSSVAQDENADPRDRGYASWGEGDILVNNSASVIKPLVEADLLDRLYLIVCPEIAGAGQRLFDDGLPGSKWKLAHHEVGDLGEIALVYDRAR